MNHFSQIAARLEQYDLDAEQLTEEANRFNASGFVKAINTATLSGKDYNDAVNKWLKANQKKYGYKYSYSK